MGEMGGLGADYVVVPDSITLYKVHQHLSVHTPFSFQIETIKFTIKNTNAVIDKSETDQNCIKMELT